MSYIVHPVTLPIDATNRMSGGPLFSTTLTEPESGEAVADSHWDEALWNWTLHFTRDGADFGKAYGFFMARRGPAFGWLLDDPVDRTDSDNDGVGLVRTFDDGKRYLCKKYPDVDDYNPYYRIIRMADTDTLVMDAPGTPVYVPGTGEVTGATDDGTATFQFVTAVQFMTDMCSIAREPGVGEWADVSVREIRNFTVAS